MSQKVNLRSSNIGPASCCYKHDTFVYTMYYETI